MGISEIPTRIILAPTGKPAVLVSVCYWITESVCLHARLSHDAHTPDLPSDMMQEFQLCYVYFPPVALLRSSWENHMTVLIPNTSCITVNSCKLKSLLCTTVSRVVIALPDTKLQS